MKNRRKHTRVKKRIHVEYGESNLNFKGVVDDISISGIYLTSRRLFEVGTRLHLRIGEEPNAFYTEGVVVRSKRVDRLLQRFEHQGMGVEFIPPSEIVRKIVPRTARASATDHILCKSFADVEKIMREQLSSGVLLVPCHLPTPKLNSTVEFTIALEIGSLSRELRGQGRVLQHLDTNNVKTAVVAVEDVDNLVAALKSSIH